MQRLQLLPAGKKFQPPEFLPIQAVTGFAGGWAIDALNPFAIYPVALAEKIAGRVLMMIWRGYAIDELTVQLTGILVLMEIHRLQKYDLVTVVLHEICHGLGFFDSMDTTIDIGWYGVSSIPLIYDTFIENCSGKRLTDTLVFQNYSI